MARSSCARLSARSKVNSRASVRFRMASFAGGRLGGQLLEALLEGLVFLNDLIHSLRFLKAAASARARLGPHVEVGPPAVHERSKRRGILRLHRRDEPLYRLL